MSIVGGLSAPFMWCRSGVGTLKLLYCFISKDVSGVNPLILQVGVSLPFDKLLQFLPSAEMLLVQNLLNFIFFFSIYQFWWQALVVAPMCGSLAVWCEKICVKNRVDAPLCGKFEAIIDIRHHLDDFKRTMSPGRKLCGWLICPKVTSLKPHLISHLIFGRIFVLDP